MLGACHRNNCHRDVFATRSRVAKVLREAWDSYLITIPNSNSVTVAVTATRNFGHKRTAQHTVIMVIAPTVVKHFQFKPEANFGSADQYQLGMRIHL